MYIYVYEHVIQECSVGNGCASSKGRAGQVVNQCTKMNEAQQVDEAIVACSKLMACIERGGGRERKRERER